MWANKTTVTKKCDENENCLITGNIDLNLLKIKKRITFINTSIFTYQRDIFSGNNLSDQIFEIRKKCFGTQIGHSFNKYLDDENYLSSDIFISSLCLLNHLPYFAYLDIEKRSAIKSKYVLVKDTRITSPVRITNQSNNFFTITGKLVLGNVVIPKKSYRPFLKE